MLKSAPVPKRRVTGREEAELVSVATELAAAEEQAAQLRVQRDELIVQLLETNARVADIAEILGMSLKGVRDARDRSRAADRN